MPFLYFPEDKTEYIPAVVSFVIFMTLLVITFRWIRKTSKKQELATKEIEERILEERREAMEKKHSQN